MQFNIKLPYINVSKSEWVSKPLWTKASAEDIDGYKSMLDSVLDSVHVPFEALQCTNLSCDDVNHLTQISKFHDDIIHSCLRASDQHIPHNSPGHRGKPGWLEHVEPARQTALFWHQMWKDNGKPHNGWVAEIRRKTRANYHLAVRNLKRKEDEMRANVMATSILGDKSRSFWTEVRKIRKNGSTVCSQIDGLTNADDIANKFASKYQEVYNSVSYDSHRMNTFLDKLQIDIAAECKQGNCSYSHAINVLDVQTALRHLKSGKNDGNLGYYTDHLINGTQKLHVHISLLLTSMVTHAFTPTEMLLSTIVPIPKDTRKSISDSANYRGIALSSCIGKLLDWILIKSNPHIFSSSDLQFAYKSDSSTTQCSFIVDETINYFTKHGSDVHTILLDASKAFDRVNYLKLFNTLLRKGICPVLCRFLALQYSLQKCQVKWSNSYSKDFNVSNGVKQGGVLSPVLFTIYMDELLGRLRDSGVGCYIGNIFMGAFGYADDVILLAPTRSAMDMMLSICAKFSDESKILFNGTKSKHIFFSKSKIDTDVRFTMQGSSIPLVANDKHLGNIIGKDRLIKSIDNAIKELYVNTNLLLSQFSACNIDVKYRLFKSYCMSVYGSQLWDFSSHHCERFYTAWRKCVRRLIGVPNTTHRCLLHLICNDTNVDTQLHCRVLNFLLSCSKSKSSHVQVCLQEVISGSRSAMSKSWVHVRNLYNIDSLDDINVQHIKCNYFNILPEQDLIQAAVIHDMLNLYNSTKDCDIMDIVIMLCTD